VPLGSPPSAWPKRNVVTLAVFGPVLILTGIAGLLVPPTRGLMSGATPYDVFHIVCGVLGTAIALARRARAAAAFNVGFGLVDLYQALAGALGVFPAPLFGLRPADHVVHVLLGVALVVVGAPGLVKPVALSGPGSLAARRQSPFRPASELLDSRRAP
jgi:hypothetical protein